MANLNPDVLYNKSRTDLLLYEDMRLQSLLNATANFYLVRNDQSTWGAFLRALSQEMARLDFDYAYDIVSKNPAYLTPSDIKRQWADPLYISGAYPASGQSDLDYRTMLVNLLAAYLEGATPKAISDLIFAYTGLHIQILELYKLAGDGIYDVSDSNAIKVSVNVGGNDPLLDVQTLNQLQLIVNSLYTAIDQMKPAHVGLEFTTVFGTDENIFDFDEDISLSPEDGIADDLTIVFRVVEDPPFNPMLYQAPILDPANPNTTLAPFGRQFAGSLLTLSSGDWSALPEVSFDITNAVGDGTNATYTYSAATGDLYDGLQVTITGCTNVAFNVTARISEVTDNTFTIPLFTAEGAESEAATGVVTPTIQSAYIPDGASYTIGQAAWDAATAFFPYQVVIDTNGNTQMAVGAGSTDTLLPGTHATLTTAAAHSGANTTYTGVFPNPFLPGYPAKVSGFLLNENNGTYAVVSCDATILVLANGAGRIEAASALATFNPWGSIQNIQITDGTVTWRMVGAGTAYIPSYKWIMVLDTSVNPSVPTGVISNWDVVHPVGLVGPRLNQSWEISGGDAFAGFEMQ